MKLIRRIALLSALTVALMAGIILPVSAMNNPDIIRFYAVGTTPVYRAFYNVLQANDLLVIAEQYVHYSEAASLLLQPDGAGIDTNLSPSAGANWQCVSDNNNATYVTTNSTTYIRDLYALPNYYGEGVIGNVGVYFRIMNSGAGTAYGIPEIYINGQHYSGTAQSATTAWSTKSEAFSTNPATGVAWTWNDINTLQVGVSLATSASTSNASASEVYAVVSYTSVNPGYPANQAFLFEILNTSGNVTLASVPLNQYEAKPISIYLTATQRTAANISVGDAIGIRITGNPLIFPSSVNNTVTAYLNAGDYFDQLLGVDNGIATSNMLRNFIINILAQDLQTYDNPPSGSQYIDTIQGVKYLTPTGADIFVEGIPSLDSMCPIAFEVANRALTGDAPASTGAYVSGLSPLAKWGQTASDGLTNLGVYFGFSQAIAGTVVLFFIGVALAIYAFAKTQSPIAIILLSMAVMFFGSWLGLIPLALVFVVVIAIVILAAWTFFSQRNTM